MRFPWEEEGEVAFRILECRLCGCGSVVPLDCFETAAAEQDSYSPPGRRKMPSTKAASGDERNEGRCSRPKEKYSRVRRRVGAMTMAGHSEKRWDGTSGGGHAEGSLAEMVEWRVDRQKTIERRRRYCWRVVPTRHHASGEDLEETAAASVVGSTA